MNGATLAFFTAACTHASAGLPAAPPLTTTERTLPSDWKVTLIRVGLSVSAMHAFTAPLTAPSAPSTAAFDGFSCFASGFFPGEESPG